MKEAVSAVEIQKVGGQALAKACNVLDKEQLADCCSGIKTQWGSIDLLITGAGGNDPRSTTDNEFLESELALEGILGTVVTIVIGPYKRCPWTGL